MPIARYTLSIMAQLEASMPNPEASILVQMWEAGRNGSNITARSRLYAATKRWAQGRKFFAHTWATPDGRIHIRVYLDPPEDPPFCPT